MLRCAPALRLDGEFHQQDRVLGRQPHQHQQADKRRQHQPGPHDEQARESAGQGQGQCGEDSDGFKEAAKQQHHHRKNKTYTRHDGAAKIGEQLVHPLAVAVGRLSDACGQRLHNRQVGDRRRRLSKGDTVELGLYHDTALAVVALDSRHPGLEVDVRDRRQRNRAAPRGRYPEVAQARQVGARLIRQPYPDGQSLFAAVELGGIGVDITEGCHPGDRPQGLRTDAQACRLGGLG